MSYKKEIDDLLNADIYNIKEESVHIKWRKSNIY